MRLTHVHRLPFPEPVLEFVFTFTIHYQPLNLLLAPDSLKLLFFPPTNHP